jgi:hypothetical protein
MCRNLDLQFLLFYCLLSKFFFPFFPPLFTFFYLAFYYLFSFCRIGFCFYRPSFSLFFFDIVLFLFLWLMWFYLYPTPTCLGLKGLVVVVKMAKRGTKERTDYICDLLISSYLQQHCPSHTFLFLMLFQ